MKLDRNHGMISNMNYVMNTSMNLGLSLNNGMNCSMNERMDWGINYSRNIGWKYEIWDERWEEGMICTYKAHYSSPYIAVAWTRTC